MPCDLPAGGSRVRQPGALIASGRDADIFECGPGLVVRRSRAGRPMHHEALTMEFLRSEGYPVPSVESVSEDGTELVMERIYGRSMVELMSRAPWTITGQGKLLAELHEHLHSLRAPEFLQPSPVGEVGNRILHLDLHPLNVMVTKSGPVVIDWANTKVGDPDVDVAVAWLLIAGGQIPGGKLLARLLGWGRGILVEGFSSSFDRSRIASKVRSACEWKCTDAHLSPSEVDRMWSIVDEVETRWI